MLDNAGCKVGESNLEEIQFHSQGESVPQQSATKAGERQREEKSKANQDQKSFCVDNF